MSEDSKEYRSYQSLVNQVADGVKRKAFKAKDAPVVITPEQIKWGEATEVLMNSPAFKAYSELEATMQASALMRAFSVSVGKDEKGNSIPSVKTYGEQVSFNEGFYRGLLAMKAERERVWMLFLKYKQQKSGD